MARTAAELENLYTVNNNCAQRKALKIAELLAEGKVAEAIELQQLLTEKLQKVAALKQRLEEQQAKEKAARVAKFAEDLRTNYSGQLVSAA